MVSIRFACALLAVGSAAAVACASTGEPSTKASAPATVISAQPSESLLPLLERTLPNVHGKSFTAAVVAFPPGARAVPHQHGDAFVYAYVLEGSVWSKLAGEPTRTYHQGQNWVEQPGARHLLTENTSRTEPARLLVVFISDTGAPLKTPLLVNHAPLTGPADDRPATIP
jgi:quercetin dioxygenase-like cupin family protein